MPEQAGNSGFLVQNDGGFQLQNKLCFLGPERAEKERNLLSKAYHNEQAEASKVSVTPPDFPPQRVVERKIGRATFIVASRFNDEKEKDVVSTLARLVQYDSDKK